MASGIWVIIGSGNFLFVQRQAISRTYDDLLSVGPSGTNLNEI